MEVAVDVGDRPHRSEPVLDHEVLEHRRGGLAGFRDQHGVGAGAVEDAQRGPVGVHHTSQGDSLAVEVDRFTLEVGLGREQDELAVARRVDRVVD